MKKSLKTKTTLIMVLTACCSLVCGLALFTSPVKFAKADAPATFEMLGASIRYETAENANDNGIRFGVQLDKTAYNALVADENAEAGILICPKDQYASNLVVGTEKATKGIIKGSSVNSANVMIGSWTENAAGYMQTWVYMMGIPEESFNRPISGRAYIDWDGDESDISYSDTVTKAIADVALAVRDDYEDSNAYSTTAEQYESLDEYLLNYDVKFLDAYGNATTQSVKYGSFFEEPEDLEDERIGFEFNGWHEKNGASSYEESATDFSDTTVKYSRVFKAGFDIEGPAYEKPALNASSAVFVEGDWSWMYQSNSKIQMNSSAYLFDDITIPYGDYYDDVEDTEYAVTATFKPTASGNTLIYPKVGFTFSGAEGKHLEVAYDAYNDRIRVYQKGVSDKYRYYPNESGIKPYEQGVALDEEYESTTLTIVYRNPKFFYVYIDGVYACEINLRYRCESGNYGYGGNEERHCRTIGTSDAKLLRVGLSVDNGYAEFYDYGYRIFDTYENVINLQSGATIDSFCCDLSNSTNFPASGTGKNPQFEVTATSPANPLLKYAYFSLSAASGQALHIGYNVATSRVRVQIGTLYREYTIKTDGGYSNGYNSETANVFKLTYDGSVTFKMYINGKEAYLTNGFSNAINMRYGMDGDDSSKVSSTKAWHGFAGSSAGTSGKTLGIGFSYTVPADEYDFAYSTDGDYTVASEVTLKLPKVANFKSNVGGTTDAEKAKYPANLSEFGNNSPFTVTATLDADYAGGAAFVGFTFSAYGKMLKVGYNQDTSRVRVQVDSKYREYTIKTDGGYSNGYNSTTANVFKLYYNGGAEMQLYINNVEAYLTDGFSGSICLRYGMDGSNSSSDGSVKAWHGFAGSSEAEGNARTLYIGTLGEGMIFNDISLDYIDIASFKSNVSNSGNFPAGGTGSNNPTFDVTATLDAAHAGGKGFVGFTLVTKGSGLLVGYNQATNRVRVQVGSKYREYTIKEGKNGYNASGTNTFRLIYNGGATLRLYINGVEADCDGFGVDGVGTINLRYGMDGSNSSLDGSVKAWHGFAGSGETEGVTRTLHIGTFGDGMTGPAFTE